MRKLISILLVILMALLTAGCDGSPAPSSSALDESKPPEERALGEFVLPFSATDTLNPYTAKTKTNQELSLLLFEPLIRLDEHYNATHALAEDVKFVGKTCIITLKNATFSDGSAVTAEDVTYSMKQAMNSSTKYKAQLENVAGQPSAAGLKTVSIILKEIDPDFINLLDFPILKMNSISRVNSDLKPLPPIGCGRYIFDEDNFVELKANTAYIGSVPKIPVILLLNTPDSTSLQHNIEVGSVSMYYNEDGLSGLKGNGVAVPLNNLVYIGVNLNKPILKETAFRQALSEGISRADVQDTVYHNYARAAYSVFNPALDIEMEDGQRLPIRQNVTSAVEKLGTLGYNEKDVEGYLLNGNKRLSFELLVNSGNAVRVHAAESIALALKSAGIEIKVVGKDTDAMGAALAAGKFDLFLGETKLQNNHSLSHLIIPGGSLAFGMPTGTPAGSSSSSAGSASSTGSSSKSSANSSSDGSSDASSADESRPPADPAVECLTAVKTAYDAYRTDGDAAVFSKVFNTQLPIIPMLYRYGALNYSSRAEGVWAPSVSDIFFNINEMVIYK